MSWIRSELAKERFGAQLPCSTHVEFSEFREGIGLQWYLGYCDTNLTPEDLGAIIDHCTVEFTLLLFSCLEAGKATTEYFKWATSKVYDGMHEDQDLKAYAVKLMKNEEIPLASETYLQLVRYHALYGENPAPCIEEGSAFARGMLLEVMKEGYEEFDIEQQTYIELRAYNLILYPSPSQLLKVMEEASESPAAWDALRLLVADAVERREVHKLPRSLLEWSAGTSFGRPKRPEPKAGREGTPLQARLQA